MNREKNLLDIDFLAVHVRDHEPDARGRCDGTTILEDSAVSLQNRS